MTRFAICGELILCARSRLVYWPSRITLGFVGVAWALVVFECGFGRCGFSHRQRLFRIDKRVAEVEDGRWSFVSAISLLMHA